MVVPVIKTVKDNMISGSIVGPNGVDYIAAFIDVYTVDPAALAKTNYWPAAITHPSRWLGTFYDNGPGDLDPAANDFKFDLSSFGLSADTYLTVAVTYSQDAAAANTDRAITGPMALPIAQRPAMQIQWRASDSKLVVSWLANEGAFLVQESDSLKLNDWVETFGPAAVYTSGRNVQDVPIDSFTPPNLFLRLISQ